MNTFYQIDPSNGYYAGATQTVSDIAPIGCVRIAPPALTPGQYAKWVGGAWEITTTAPTQTAVVYAPPKPLIPPFDFYQRFTSAERIAVRALASTDAVAEDFYATLQAAIASGTQISTENVDIVDGVNYLAANPTSAPVLTASRVAAILA
jgi:hypothetical protein